MRLSRLAFGAALAAGVVAATAHADTAQDLDQKLSEVSAQYEHADMAAKQSFARLSAMQSDQLSFVASAGVAYVVAAACDQDCDGIAAELYNAEGMLMAAEAVQAGTVTLPTMRLAPASSKQRSTRTRTV